MGKSRKKSVRGGGTVFLRKDGRWEARFKVEETGKYKSLYASTEKEAYQRLEEAKLQQKQGTLAVGPQQTVKHFLEYWLEDVQKPTVRLGTYVGNRVLVYKHLIPGIGHIKLQKLTAQQLQSFYAKRLKEKTSVSRVKAMNTLLHKALDHAKRLKLVGANVSEDVVLPRYSSPERDPLTSEQAHMFVEKVKEHRLEALLTLALTNAMRRGELLGLRWSDVDLERNTLYIRRTLNYITGYGFVEGEPKTAKSKRELTLPPFVVEVLRQHYVTQQEKRLQVGSSWQNLDLVFPNKKGGFLAQTTLQYQFSKLLKDVGLPQIHFHDLRHSAATLLLSMGVPERVVQEILGHTTSKQTWKYLHVSKSMQREAMDKMDDFFKKP